MWSDAARASSMQARGAGGGQGAAQGGALQAGLASAGAGSRGAWGKGKTGKQPAQKVTITGEKNPSPTGGSTDGGRAGVAAHQAGVNGIRPNMGSTWLANVATNAYATGSRPLVPTGDGGYRYQKFDD